MQWAVDWRQTVQFVNRNNDDYLNKFDSLIWNDAEHVIGNKIYFFRHGTDMHIYGQIVQNPVNGNILMKIKMKIFLLMLMKIRKIRIKIFPSSGTEMLIKISIIQWIGKYCKLMTWHLTHYYAWVIKLYIHTFFIPFNTVWCLLLYFVSSTSSSMQILPWIFDFMCCLCSSFLFSLFSVLMKCNSI